MAKKIKTIIKLNIAAGEATAAPPVGPALGQHGLPIMDFVRSFNEKTQEQKGTILPAVITVLRESFSSGAAARSCNFWERRLANSSAASTMSATSVISKVRTSSTLFWHGSRPPNSSRKTCKRYAEQ